MTTIHQFDEVKKRRFKSQILDTCRQFKPFIFGYLLVLFFTYICYVTMYSFSSTLFNLWIFVAATLGGIALIVSKRYFERPQDYSFRKLDHLLQSFSFLIGLVLGCGYVVIHYLLMKQYDTTDLIHQISLTTLVIHVTLIIAITCLTSRLRNFFLLFVPSTLPLFLTHAFALQSDSFVYYNGLSFALLIIVLCAIASHHTRMRVSNLMLKNEQLMHKTDEQRRWTEALCQQLQEEMNRSKEIEQELHQHNQLLEQKVKERTFDIERINSRLERSHQNLELAHETAGIGSWDWDIANRFVETTNFSNSSFESKDSKSHHYNLTQAIHPDDLLSFKTAMKMHLRGFSERYESVYRIKNKTQGWVWVQDLGRVIQRDPKTNKPQRMVGIRRNINDEKKSEERLKLSASVFEQAAEGIFILDDKLTYVDINPCYEKVTGLSKDQIIGQHIFDITTNRNLSKQNHHVLILSQLMKQGEFDGEVVEKFISGKEVPLWMHINSIRDSHHRITHFIGIISDLTERKNHEKRLSYLETYDALTDLPNRNFYNSQLHLYITDSVKAVAKFAVIRLNIDRFRYLNDTLNNNGGDELLKQVARRLRVTNSDALVIARLNGDDFAVIYEVMRGRDIKAHCQHIMCAFQEPFLIQGQEFIITLSIGVALYPEHGRQMDSLNNHAEQALLEAKKLGGNTVQIFQAENRLSSSTRLSLESDLRKAIHNDELVTYYQPKLDAATEQVLGFEALVRWHHPKQGLIPPAQFIPLAEETSLISDIGRIVIQQSARQLRLWKDMGFDDITISVNIVAQQIQRGQLLQEIDQAIAENNIESKNLELEITESSLMDDSDIVQQVLQAFKDRHITVSLDDFGTGYSSLAYLGQYPIDIIKMDRSFISKIGTENQEAIVSAIIAMGKAMGMKIVAEGVETLEQATFLKSQGCDILQGYLFAKPLPPLESTKYLQEKSAQITH